MIKLTSDGLGFSFPRVHQEADLSIRFMRTLRIPDDGKDYPLPPGFDEFPLCDIDDFAGDVPLSWLEHGGVMLPMYQSEAMWISFHGYYPCAVKISTGMINAVNGESNAPGLKNPPQNYLVIPDQPWLDGYCVEKGIIRQFVAMPLGSGYSAEEQITGEGEYGGLQIVVYPMKKEVYAKIHRERRAEICEDFCFSPDMGLAPGGRMEQEIYEDEYGLDAWDTEHAGRCYVRIANSLVWRAITGENPPTTPPTSKEYTDQGLPWFEYYNETADAVDGSEVLAGLKSVLQKGSEKGDAPLPENIPVTPENIIKIRANLKKGQVREPGREIF